MKSVAALAITIVAVALSGCGSDKRTLNDRLRTPRPDLASRPVMASPVDGAPTRPYRITETKSYYKSSGDNPHFPHHKEYSWSIKHEVPPELEKVKAQEELENPAPPSKK